MQKHHANGTYHDILKDETFASLLLAAHKIQQPSHFTPDVVHEWYQYY